MHRAFNMNHAIRTLDGKYNRLIKRIRNVVSTDSKDIAAGGEIETPLYSVNDLLVYHVNQSTALFSCLSSNSSLALSDKTWRITGRWGIDSEGMDRNVISVWRDEDAEERLEDCILIAIGDTEYTNYKYTALTLPETVNNGPVKLTDIIEPGIPNYKEDGSYDGVTYYMFFNGAAYHTTNKGKAAPLLNLLNSIYFNKPFPANLKPTHDGYGSCYILYDYEFPGIVTSTYDADAMFNAANSFANAGVSKIVEQNYAVNYTINNLPEDRTIRFLGLFLNKGN